MPTPCLPRLWLRWPSFSRRAARAVACALAAAPPAPRGTRPVLFVTDLHGRLGMARVIAATARALGASLVLNAGDTTIHGLRPEGLFVRALARALPEGTTMVACGGNHDSTLTDRQCRRAGIVMLAGRVISVGGLRLLGDSDPRLTSLGRPAVQQGRDSIAGQAARLERVAEASQQAGAGVDVLLVHDPYVAVRVLAAGRVPLGLCGHMHARRGPEAMGGGVLYQGSSTGRDVRQTTVLGPLRDDAELTVFYFSERTRRASHYRIISVHPGGGVSPGDVRPLPAGVQP